MNPNANATPDNQQERRQGRSPRRNERRSQDSSRKNLQSPTQTNVAGLLLITIIGDAGWGPTLKLALLRLIVFGTFAVTVIMAPQLSTALLGGAGAGLALAARRAKGGGSGRACHQP